MWSAAVLCVSQHSWLTVRLSLPGNSGTMVSNSWGVLPRFLQGQTCGAGVRIRPDVIVDIRLESVHRQTTVEKRSTGQTGTSIWSNAPRHRKLSF